MKFIRKLIARAAASIALRASTLNHEIRNHTVKSKAIVKRPLFFLAAAEFLGPFRQPDEILHGLRRFFLQQPNYDISLRGFENRVRSCRSAHSISQSTMFCAVRFAHIKVHTNYRTRARLASATQPVTLA